MAQRVDQLETALVTNHAHGAIDGCGDCSSSVNADFGCMAVGSANSEHDFTVCINDHWPAAEFVRAQGH